MKTREEYLFEEAPVSRAVLSLVVPTVISQLITVIYNMADTFFIGQIGDPKSGGGCFFVYADVHIPDRHGKPLWHRWFQPHGKKPGRRKCRKG